MLVVHSLSTGINTNNDVVSSFLGNKLADKSKILDIGCA